MKRCLIPGIIALSIHGLLFAMEFEWPIGEAFLHQKTSAITMTLSYFQTEKTQPIVNKPKAAPAPKKAIKKVKMATSKSKPRLDPKPDFIHRPKLNFDPTILKTSKPALWPEKTETRIQQKTVQNPIVTFESITPVLLTSGPVPQPKASPAPVIRKARPLYRRNPPPRYPRIARKRKYQGVVILEVFVNREGSVGDVKVYKSSGYTILDKSALKTVRKWEFEPGMHGDKNMGMWVRVPVRYQLK